MTDDQGDTLVLYHTKQEDSGRYVCRVYFIDGTSTENYVDLAINREYRRKRHPRYENDQRGGRNYYRN
jgi:hypothetical protein